MDPAALLGLCALIARGQAPPASLADVKCPPSSAALQAYGVVLDGRDLAGRLAAPGARDAIARVAFAEAANQGDSGLAGVVYTILNRLGDGRWGTTVDAVLNAPSQFEPVMRAGGDWRRLPAVTAADQARIDTILNLAVEGRLPDLTGGARFFQNPSVVASRARAGTVPSRLVNFGGQAPSAVIGAHSFYTGQGRGQGAAAPVDESLARTGPASMFVGENRVRTSTEAPAEQSALAAPESFASELPVGDPGRGLFVARDGTVRADRR
jgi:N-acetylmuramoyl-L-alanine amidase